MYQEEKISKILNFVISAALTIAAALFVLNKIGTVFETNDDAMIRNIASGSFTGSPDAHLIYVMYPLGLILKGLYTALPNMFWYDGLIVGLHFLCLFLILIKVANFIKNPLNRIAGVVVTFAIFIVFEIEFTAVNQYTELAGLTAATALLYLGTHNYRKKTVSDVVITIALGLVTLWLRKQVFFMTIPLVILTFIISIFETNDTMDDKFGRFRKTHIPVAVFILLAVGSFVCEYMAYSTPEWKSFKAFNEARTEVYDYNLLADYDSNVDLYDSLGLTKADYTALREYDVVLLDELDTQTLKAISNRAEEEAKEWAKYYSVPRKIINDTVAKIYELATMPIALAFYILSVALFLFCFLADDRLSGLFTVAGILYSWAFVGFFTYKNRLPERVSHGFFLIELIFLAVIYLRIMMKNKNNKVPSLFWEILIGVGAVFFLGVLCINSYRRTVDAYREKEALTVRWVEANRYFKANQDKVFVLNNSVYAAAGDVLFTEGTTMSYNVITSNWTLGSPLEKQREARLLDKSVECALVNNDNVYFVQLSGKDLEWLTELFGSVEVYDTVLLSDGTSYDIISVGK